MRIWRTRPAQVAATMTRLEVALLLCCLHTHSDSARAERLRMLFHHDLDWEYLLQVAARHGIIPLLYHGLNAATSAAVPQTVLAQLRSLLHCSVQHNLLLTGHLLALLKLFETHHIPAITFKGPLLAAAVYGSLALRQFDDLDILIRPQDVQRAHHLLRNEGYDLCADYTWQQLFVHPRSNVHVDLHQAMTPSYFVTTSLLDFERLWQRRQPCSLGGQTIGNLAPEDWLILLALQVAREGWLVMKGWSKQIPLLKLCDLAELLRRHQPWDWQSLLEHVNHQRIARPLLSGLLLVHEVLGAAVSEAVLHRSQSDPVVRFYVRQMQRYLSAELNAWPQSHPNAFAVHLFETYTQHRMRECPRHGVPHTLSRLWHRFRFVWQPLWTLLHLAITPTDGDHAVFPLPHPLHFLYYLIRPIRLLRKYGLSSCIGSRRHGERHDV